MKYEAFDKLFEGDTLPACNRGLSLLHEFTQAVERDDERESAIWWKTFSIHRNDCEDCQEK